MLAADKDILVYDLKQKALSLRKQELEMVVSRYNNLVMLTSLAAGFSFDAIVELEFPESIEHGLDEDDPALLLKPLFYISSSLALATSLYVVAVASFTVVHGHQLALLGSQSNSLDRAVAVMLKQHHQLYGTAACSLFFILLSATTIAWIKMESAWALVSTCIFVGVTLLLIYALRRIDTMLSDRRLVHGNLHIKSQHGAEIDLARIRAKSGVIRVERSFTGLSDGDASPSASWAGEVAEPSSTAKPVEVQLQAPNATYTSTSTGTSFSVRAPAAQLSPAKSRGISDWLTALRAVGASAAPVAQAEPPPLSQPQHAACAVSRAPSRAMVDRVFEAPRPTATPAVKRPLRWPIPGQSASGRTRWQAGRALTQPPRAPMRSSIKDHAHTHPAVLKNVSFNSHDLKNER